MTILNVSDRGTRWRVYEKEMLEKHFGNAVDLQTNSSYQSIDFSNIQAVFWRLNSDEMTQETLSWAMDLYYFLDKKNIKSINSPTAYLNVHCKDEAFATWEKASVRHPECQVFNSADEIKINYPFLIRLNNEVTGRSSYLVKNKAELDHYSRKLEGDFNKVKNKKPFTRKIAVKFIDASKEDGKYNLSYRVIVAGDSVITGYARLSEATDWVAITGKFKEEMGPLFIKYQERCNNIMKERKQEIIRSVSSLGLDLQGVDIIEDQDGRLYFLECQPGFSTGYADWRRPFYNPYQSPLVEFILKNQNEFKTRCPLYFNNWLNKKRLFNLIFNNLQK